MKKAISNFLVKFLIRKSRVVSNLKIGETFQLLSIKLNTSREWVPGQKIQIMINDKELRSYTPLKWEKDNRSFQTLIYNHKLGPGALWAQSVEPMTKVKVIGPRKSLDMSTLEGNAAFFGDETTFGLAFALREASPSQFLHFFFEVNDVKESRAALEFLGFADIPIFKRAEDDSHLPVIAEKMMARKDATLILSGKKSSISFLKERLKDAGVPAEKLILKKYWGWKKEGH